mmetsp:Transcript_8240/g.15082  ORF Transcript_8240/g.15082 Transcript_8240/m.15082 type:complete len:279 (+) Transcript_8240:2088-2924(+)
MSDGPGAPVPVQVSVHGFLGDASPGGRGLRGVLPQREVFAAAVVRARGAPFAVVGFAYSVSAAVGKESGTQADAAARQIARSGGARGPVVALDIIVAHITNSDIDVIHCGIGGLGSDADSSDIDDERVGGPTELIPDEPTVRRRQPGQQPRLMSLIRFALHHSHLISLLLRPCIQALGAVVHEVHVGSRSPDPYQRGVVRRQAGGIAVVGDAEQSDGEGRRGLREVDVGLAVVVPAEEGRLLGVVAELGVVPPCAHVARDVAVAGAGLAGVHQPDVVA